jgi:hypothetical protein
MQLQKATRKKVKMRLVLAAASGFGKTYSALLIAYGMCGDWAKIAVVDTENGSASLYSHLGDYYTIELQPPFTPQKYMQAIKVCEDGGMEVIIIDSVTHVWKGEGGLLEFQNQLGGRYQDWAKTTPLYQKWLSSILYSSCHVITTTRKKQAYFQTTENGKTKVEKAGMEDEIRDGYEYEMTLALEIVNDRHMTKASKDRTGIFAGKPEFIITPETGRKIKEWCEVGIQPEPVKPKITSDALHKAIARIGSGEHEVFEKVKAAFSLTPEQYQSLTQAYGYAIKPVLNNIEEHKAELQ